VWSVIILDSACLTEAKLEIFIFIAGYPFLLPLLWSNDQNS
jgi:hypothetical protein